MPEDKAVLIKTAYSYYQKGDWNRAIEEYHKLAELDPKDLNVHNMLADIHAKKGDVKEALQQYDLVAQGFDQKNQVDKVLQVYKRMLKLVPNDPQLTNAVKNLVDKYIGRAVDVEAEDIEKATDIYRSILKAEPERQDVNLQYARLLSRKGQKFEAVESLMNLAANLDPETQTGRLVEVLQTATDLDPLNIEARERLSELLIQAKDIPQAIKSLQNLIEIFISKNDLKKAEETAQKSIQLGDQNTYYHLGVIYFNQQKYNESREAFERFLRQQEAHVGALKYLALTYLRLNQSAEAVQVYLRILEVYFNENLLDEARDVRQTILELDPQNEAVKRFALDQHLIAPESLDAALSVSTADESARLEAEQQQDLLSQAAAYTEKGFYEQAIDVYLDMLKRWPEWPDLRIRLQQVYALMARAIEPVEKRPSSEEIKSELEKELREQMKKELEEQARAAHEHQREQDMKRELEQMKLKQELETKLLEQVQRSKEEDLRHQMTREFEERQRILALEREKLEKEKSDSFSRLKAELEETKTSLEQKIREQVEREMKDKFEKENQRQIQLEKDLREKEVQKQAQLEKEMKERLEKESLRQAQLEKELREKEALLEKELKEKMEKEDQRQLQLKMALEQEAQKRQHEEEERKKFITQRQEQEAAKAKINQEILQGMERLRLEKEKEVRTSPVVLPTSSEKTVLVESSNAPSGGVSQEVLDDPFIRQTLADIYAKQGLYVEALKIYERILNDEPHNEDVRGKLRDLLRMKGI